MDRKKTKQSALVAIPVSDVLGEVSDPSWHPSSLQLMVDPPE